MHVIREINKSANSSYSIEGSHSFRTIAGRKTRLELDPALLFGPTRSIMEEHLVENLEDFQKDSNTAISHKDKVLSLLRKENQELFNKMKKMNSEIDVKIHNIKHRRNSPRKIEMHELYAREEINNMDTQIILLEKELKWLRQKAKKEVGSEKQLHLQRVIQQRQKQIEEIQTIIRSKGRSLKENENKIYRLDSNQENEQKQRNEGKLVTLIQTEREKVASLQLHSEQQVKLAELRAQKIAALQVQIRIQLQQIESLKNEYKSTKEIMEETEIPQNSTKEQLLQQITELKSCLEKEGKEQTKEKFNLEATVQNLRQQLKFHLYENRVNSHKLQEASRKISMSQRKARSKSPLGTRAERSVAKMKCIEKYKRIKLKSKTPLLARQDSTDKPAGSIEEGEDHPLFKDKSVGEGIGENIVLN